MPEFSVYFFIDHYRLKSFSSRSIAALIIDHLLYRLGDACDLNEQLQPLTTIERSYLQTFPKTFKFKGSKSDLGQAIGNAGSVNLAKYVANCIKENIDRAIVFDTTEEQLQQVNINDRQLQLFKYNDLKLTKNKNSDNISIDNDRSQKYLLTDRKTAPSR